MTWIRPSSLQAVLLCAFSAGCGFDATPRVRVREVDGGSSKWQPPSAASDGGSTGQQTRAASSEGRASAGKSANTMTSADAGMRAIDGDAGSKVSDAAKPAQPEPKRDAAPSAGNNPGPASPMGTMAGQDASVPAVTMPEAQSECMPGLYEGPFDGPVTFAIGSINSVTGTVSADFALEESGESLSIRNGVITGMDAAGTGMSAVWTGTLNCATKKLENGRLEAGKWEDGSTFTGTLEGTYTANPSAMSGTWKVQSGEIPLAGGNGKWSMTLRNR